MFIGLASLLWPSLQWECFSTTSAAYAFRVNVMHSVCVIDKWLQGPPVMDAMGCIIQKLHKQTWDKWWQLVISFQAWPCNIHSVSMSPVVTGHVSLLSHCAASLRLYFKGGFLFLLYHSQGQPDSISLHCMCMQRTCRVPWTDGNIVPSEFKVAIQTVLCA